MTTYAPGPYYLLDQLRAHEGAKLIIEDLLESYGMRQVFIVGVPCHKDIVEEELRSASSRLERKIAKIKKELKQVFGNEFYKIEDLI